MTGLNSLYQLNYEDKIMNPVLGLKKHKNNFATASGFRRQVYLNTLSELMTTFMKKT